MKLQLFRNHLASELNGLPDVRVQEIQSYALTTAILVRRIIERLQIIDLSIPDADDAQVIHGLRKILNAFVHYRDFYPHFPSSSIRPERGIVHLESSREKFRISLRSYFDLIRRFAHDDLFLSHYLLRRVVTLLGQVVNQPGKDFNAPVLVNISELMADSFALLGRLVESGAIEISPNLVMDGYRQEVRWSETGGMEGLDYLAERVPCVEIIAGYGSTWGRYPFVPRKVEINNVNLYMEGIERYGMDGAGNAGIFSFPFNGLLSMFKDVQGRCEATSR